MILVQTLVKDLFNMKKKIFFSGFLLMTMFCGCMTQNEITSSIAKLETVEKSVNDTLFLQNPQVFCLETKDNALIKRINRVIEWKNTYYILDKSMKQVLAFNDKGKHLFTIHRVGAGKGEYGSILDIAIDRQNENLVFLADPTSLIYYDLQGNFIRTTKLPGHYHSIAIDNRMIYLENATLINNQLSTSSITVIAPNDQKTELLKPLREIAPYCFIGGHQLGGTAPVVFTRKFDDTIYQLEDGKISPYYSFNFMNESFPEAAKDKEYTCRELNKFTWDRYVYLMTNVTDAPQYLLFSTNLFGIYVFDKNQNKLLKYNKIYNTEYQADLHQYIPVEGANNRVFFTVSPTTLFSLKAIVDNHPSFKNKMSDKLYKLTESLDSDSNPVIFSYQVK